MGHVRQPGCGSMLRAAAATGFFAAAMTSAGCAFVMHDKIHYVAESSELSASNCQPEDASAGADRMLGIALSGGGSRAAVFGAATLEALSEHGVLGQVSHVSSVSGGSITASYLLTHPPACDGLLAPETRKACWREYFADFKAQMRVNYQTGTMWRNARPTRFSSPTRRALSLQEELDEHFLKGKTFGDLESSPIVLVNATSYDETRRFVFSNACLTEGAVKSPGGSHSHAEKRYKVMAEKALTERAARALTFSRPECTRRVPADLPVSLAVVASASFPPAIGPVAIEVPSACNGGEPEWWHLGDGGVVENSGTDSLEEILLRRLTAEGPPPQQTLFLSVDSGVYLDPVDLKRLDNFKMNATPAHVNLVVHTPRVRGQVYHDIFWEELLDDLAKNGIGFEKITFRHSEAQLEKLPGSCVGKLPGEQAIRDFLLDIPTLLKIDDCNADLLEQAAHQLVHETLDDGAVNRLMGKGFSFRTVPECPMAL